MAIGDSSNRPSAAVQESQESIVAALIQNPEAEDWAVEKIGWNVNSKEQVCTWAGVECDPIDNVVTKIFLPGEGLRATIPPKWGKLSSLTELNLNTNKISGKIPQEVASLPALELIDISNNDLTGNLPPLASPELHTLRLEKNRLVGPLPSSLTERCPNLNIVDLSHNGFSGTLSPSIASMQFLGYLDLSFNDMSGSIPHEIGNLKNLMGLFLNDNEFLGTIPPTLGHEDLKIVQLFLEHNRLSGTIPASLADLPRLVDLFLDGNKFTGTVPKDLCVLNLNEDFFKGKYDVDGRDGCDSIACPVNTVSKEGVHPCFECGKQGFNPYLGLNDKCFHISEKIILDIFYDSTNGPMWNGGAGWGISNVQKCDYDGIMCNSAGHVVNITLSRMNLRGEIPEEIGYLRHLRYLDLSDNDLSGYLPSDLRWAPLEHLDVAGNRLKGFVPPMLCLTGDINDNGANGDYNCDHIACAPGTFSPIGRATAKGTVDPVTKQTHECRACPKGATFIGSNKCSIRGDNAGEVAVAFLSHPITINVGALVVGTVLGSLLVTAIVLVLFRRWRAAHRVTSDGPYGGDPDNGGEECSRSDGEEDGCDELEATESLDVVAAMLPPTAMVAPLNLEEDYGPSPKLHELSVPLRGNVEGRTARLQRSS